VLTPSSSLRPHLMLKILAIYGPRHRSLQSHFHLFHLLCHVPYVVELIVAHILISYPHMHEMGLDSWVWSIECFKAITLPSPISSPSNFLYFSYKLSKRCKIIYFSTWETFHWSHIALTSKHNNIIPKKSKNSQKKSNMLKIVHINEERYNPIIKHTTIIIKHSTHTQSYHQA